jgi:error-prone DNA polymerase
MKPGFSEFHAHSAFSFLQGASQPEVMVRRAAELGCTAIAITDRMGFYGSARAHHAAKECGIRAVVGTMLGLPDGTHFPVLCATRDGYRMLSRHLTDHHLSAGEGGELGRIGDHLIALTGDRDGPVCRPLLLNQRHAALVAAGRLIEIFGHGNVYVEINRHGLRDEGKLNRLLMDLATHLRLPLLASNAPLHATRGDRRLADAFACLRHHLPLDQAGRKLAPNGERHLKSPQEMAMLFADLPEALRNTRRLQERIQFTLENLDYRFPDFPDGRGNPLSLTEQTTLLRRHAYTGASRRYGICSEKVKVQLEHELAMIHRLGFPGYFLIVHDLVEFARGRGILCQGRGSAANSVVCYALGITAVDPVGGGLLFERFLSENRKSWPDIDIDFPSG